MTLTGARSSRPARAFLGGCVVAAIGVAAVLVDPGVAAAAQARVGLGTAASYAVLAGSAVTNTGSSVINGDLGVSPGTSITGFPDGVVNGTTHRADAQARQAKTDLVTAYNDAAGRSPAVAVSTELGGRTLKPGVYSGGTLRITGALTLDAKGDPDAVFVFQSASTLVTASDSSVLLIGRANPCNVYWQVGSSATLGTRTSFVGTIMALASITANTGATVQGRLLAREGAVTLDTNVITVPNCATTTTTTTTAPTTTTTTTAGTTTTTTATTTTATTTTATTTTPSTPTTLPPTVATIPGAGVTTSGTPTNNPPTVATPSGGNTPSGHTSRGYGRKPPSTTTRLPRTGSETGPMSAAGFVLILIGAGAILVSRRRAIALH